MTNPTSRFERVRQRSRVRRWIFTALGAALLLGACSNSPEIVADAETIRVEAVAYLEGPSGFRITWEALGQRDDLGPIPDPLPSLQFLDEASDEDIEWMAKETCDAYKKVSDIDYPGVGVLGPPSEEGLEIDRIYNDLDQVLADHEMLTHPNALRGHLSQAIAVAACPELVPGSDS